MSIRTHSDILELECHIRRVLLCEGAQCSFLQSVPYKNLLLSILLRMNNVVTHDEEQRVSMGPHGYALHLDATGCSVEIVTPPEEPYRGGKRKSPEAGCEEQILLQLAVEKKRKRCK